MSTLEEDLEQLLEVETFDPPEEFVEQALVSDGGIYQGGREGFQGLLGRAGQSARLGHGARDDPRRVRPAVLQVVR